VRVVFVVLGIENMGVEILSAVLRQQGHDVRLAFDPCLFDDGLTLDSSLLASMLSREEQVVREVVATCPDVVGISPMTANSRWHLRVAGEVKRRLPGVRILVGGIHASAVPESVIAEDCVDAVCIGEGERAISQYLAALEKGPVLAPVSNLWLKTERGVTKGRVAPFFQDLDRLPFPDKELFEDHFDMRAKYTAMGGRGCPFRCAFCFNSFYAELPERPRGNYVRYRSPGNLMEELRWARKRYDFRYVEFQDDVFTLNKAWLREFLDAYRRDIRRPFWCLTHVRYVDDSVARMLAEAGCAYVEIGVESALDSYRRGYLDRRDTLAEIDRAVSLLERHHVPVTLDHIFDLPGEPPEAQDLALEFYARHHPMRINTYWFLPLPKTAIVQRALADGYISPREGTALGDTERGSFYRPPEASRDKARNLGYQLAFKAMPLLGAPLARALRDKVARRLPIGATARLATLFDITAALRTGNPAARAYAMQFLRRILRLARKPGNAPLPRPSRENPSLAQTQDLAGDS
jgi:radical SAM superfamily enzyme YgiQ (UPF0313 family)